jgi:hypothetical protein
MEILLEVIKFIDLNKNIANQQVTLKQSWPLDLIIYSSCPNTETEE